MDYIKLQIDALKHFIKQDRAVRFCLDGDFVVITSDGYTAFRMPSKYVVLNLDMIQKMDSLKDYFVRKADEKPGHIFPAVYRVGSDNFLKIVCENSDPVYVRKHLFDMFYDSQMIFCTSPVSPVQLVNDVTGEVEAIVLPARVHNGADM